MRNRSHELSRRYIVVADRLVITLWMSRFDKLSFGSILTLGDAGSSGPGRQSHGDDSRNNEKEKAAHASSSVGRRLYENRPRRHGDVLTDSGLHMFRMA